MRPHGTCGPRAAGDNLAQFTRERIRVSGETAISNPGGTAGSAAGSRMQRIQVSSTSRAIRPIRCWKGRFRCPRLVDLAVCRWPAGAGGNGPQQSLRRAGILREGIGQGHPADHGRQAGGRFRRRRGSQAAFGPRRIRLPGAARDGRGRLLQSFPACFQGPSRRRHREGIRSACGVCRSRWNGTKA